MVDVALVAFELKVLGPFVIHTHKNVGHDTCHPLSFFLSSSSFSFFLFLSLPLGTTRARMGPKWCGGSELQCGWAMPSSAVSTQVSPWHPRATPAPSSWTTGADPSSLDLLGVAHARLFPPLTHRALAARFSNPPSALAHHRHCSHRRRRRFSSCRRPPLWPPPTAELQAHAYKERKRKER